MVQLVWDRMGERFYSSGVDRGVFYDSSDNGFTWNGLLSVTESVDGSEITPLYFEGVRRGYSIEPGEFSGRIEAYTYPKEMEDYVGFEEYYDGFYIDERPQKPFSISYREGLGDDLSGRVHYRIHLIYDVIASFTEKSYASVNETPSAQSFVWDVVSTPRSVPEARPGSHFILDSRYLPEETMSSVENYLYGSTTSNPRLPSIETLLSLLGIKSELVVTDLGYGMYMVEGPTVKFIPPERFSINHRLVQLLDPGSFSVESS